MLSKWPNREEGPNSFRVPLEKIRENGWQLMPGRYKPVKLEAIQHDPPDVILADVIRMEMEIAERAKKLMHELAGKG
ncbi:Uncharacterised protein [uncultured archaeon]|nr:Uncharacterised protein [uncultured archaeon]